MTALLLALAATTAHGGVAAREPVLWLDPRGATRVNGVEVRARLTKGATTVRTPVGFGLEFDGRRGGLLLEDLPALRLRHSLTIAAWVYLRSHPRSGGQAQILFRGDDRAGHDPYSLCVRPDGAVRFQMDGLGETSTTLATEIPLKRWVRITASLDAGTGEIRLWRGDRLAATRITERRLLADLQAEHAPGIGIGNVQNDRGPHNQPLDGTLVDVRLYDAVLEPAEAGYKPGLDGRNP